MNNDFLRVNSKDKEEEHNEDYDFDEQDVNGQKRFCLKFNQNSSIIQLYDNKRHKVIKVISEQNLMKLLAKVKYPSGIIFTDKS